MRVNKTILSGFLLILLSGVILTTDFLNPIIRPITHIFLMGSSKGKDILFFSLFGLLLILSQIIRRDFNSTKYLKISIACGSILLISGIILEIIFRIQLGISFNNVFCSMSNSMTSTSILHTHLLKSIIGEIINQIMGSYVESSINTGIGLYSYVPNIAFIIVLLIPIEFIALVLSSQNRPLPTTILVCFFSSCLIIGSIDGGLFSTPAIVGICGLYWIYRNGFYVNYVVANILGDNKLLGENEKLQPPYDRFNTSQKKYILNRIFPYIIVIFIILLRFTVAIAGAESEYYTVEIVDIEDNVDFGNISITHINNTLYYVNSSYNEMDLINYLKVPLNNSCQYYTVSWNIYSYFMN